jgi:hypothetical protein
VQFLLLTHALITIYVAVNALVAAKLMYMTILGMESIEFSDLLDLDDADVLRRRTPILAGQPCFSVELPHQLRSSFPQHDNSVLLHMLRFLLLLLRGSLLVEEKIRHTGIPNKACHSITVHCRATH